MEIRIIDGFSSEQLDAAIENIRRLHRLFNSLGAWPPAFDDMPYHARWSEFERQPTAAHASRLLELFPVLRSLFDTEPAPITALAMMLVEPPPVADLALCLWRASVSLGKQFDPMLAPGEETQVRRVAVGCEILSFYLHLAKRVIPSNVPANARIQRKLATYLPRMWLELFVGDWPEERQADVEREWVENCRRADEEYAVCPNLFRESDPLATDAVLSRFARNVTDAAGYPPHSHYVGNTLLVIAGLDWLPDQLSPLIERAAGVV